MNMIKMMVAGLVLMVSSLSYAKSVPFFEAETGILAASGGVAPIYGIRGGFIKNDRRELSFGYWSAVGLPASKLASGGLNLHTIGVEGYLHESMGQKISVKWGGGVGLTIPNLDDGVSETADNDLSLILGGGLNYKISPKIDLGFSVKGFFFTTDTHLTTYGSHMETYSINGVPAGQVEVLDVAHSNDSVRFNAVKLAVSARW